MIAQTLGGSWFTPLGLEFARPHWLLLAPPAALLIWWIARRSLGGLEGERRLTLLVMRLLLTLTVIFALAEPSIRRTSNSVAVVVVKDVSRSVSEPHQRAIDDFLAGSVAKMRPNDRLGLVSAAREAYVHALPSASPRLEILETGDPNATNLHRAVELAKAVIPSNAAGRILLISDGNQTQGNLESAVASARAANIPIDVATVEYDRSRTIRVRELMAPAWTREDDVVNTRVLIDSGRGASGRLTITLNGKTVDLDPVSDRLSAAVELEQGLNVLNLPLHLSHEPVHEITATLEPDPSSEAADPQEGLTASAVTFTSAKGRVLAITDRPDVHASLIAALRDDDIIIESRLAANSPATLAELAGFDAVVLANQPASSFTQQQQENLARYVHDAGGGLIMIGGPNSFGAGGWIGSPVERALPIVLDPPQKRVMPMGALAIIIDRSGSMSSVISGTQTTQQQAANEAAVLGVRALSRLDQVAIIAFDGAEEVVVPMTRVDNGEEITRRIRSIGSGGGTNLFPAIDAAGAEFARTSAGVRHVMILSDGQTSGDPQEGIRKVAALRQRGITVSTVSIGDTANDELLTQLALVGGGRSYSVSTQDTLAVLPQIFIKEAQTIRRTLIWEGDPFTPSAAFPDESIRGMGPTFPAVNGYIVAADREGLSTVLLRGPKNDPILAHWQHGLGRVTAYTSDAAARWNAPWTAWESFDAFWGQQLRWTMRPSGDALARVQVHASGDPARVVVELMDEAGERVNFAAIRGRAIHPVPPDGSQATPTSDVQFAQVGPGRYEASVPARDAGVHVLSLAYDAPSASGRRTGSIRAAVIRRADEEMRRPIPDTRLLWQTARSTNGRIHSIDRQGTDLWVREGLTMPASTTAVWQPALIVAIGLFLLDVAVRRIAIEPARMRAFAFGLLAPTRARASQSLPSLGAAKARAAAALRERASRSTDSSSVTLPRPNASAPHTHASDIPSVLSPGASRITRHAAPEDQALPSDEDRMSSLLAAKRRARKE